MTASVQAGSLGARVTTLAHTCKPPWKSTQRRRRARAKRWPHGCPGPCTSPSDTQGSPQAGCMYLEACAEPLLTLPLSFSKRIT